MKDSNELLKIELVVKFLKKYSINILAFSVQNVESKNKILRTLKKRILNKYSKALYDIKDNIDMIVDYGKINHKFRKDMDRYYYCKKIIIEPDFIQNYYSLMNYSHTESSQHGSGKNKTYIASYSSK